MRTLFTSTPGLGHLHPLLPFMRAARAAGDEVLVTVGAAAVPNVERHGFAAVAMDEPSPEEFGAAWAGLPADDPDTYVVSQIFGRLRTRAAIAGMLRLVDRYRPDLVISESVEPAGHIAADAAGVPHVSVGVSPMDIPALDVEPLIGEIDAIRAEVGLAPAGVVPWRHRSRFVTAVPPALWQDFASAPAGTLLYRHEDAEGAAGIPAPRRAPGRRPRVYATLGSAAGGISFAEQAFPAVLAGLGDVDADVLFTTVAYDPERFGTVPANVRVARHAPYRAAMACDAVVHHGGAGTTVATLSRGLPAVVVPLFGDQPHNAARVEAVGAGLAVRAGEAREALPAALRRVLAEPCHAERAGRVAAEIGTYPTAGDVFAEVRPVAVR
jgi:UDP:flavonoid glycosyltransferase YjiC (YdhE family)